MEGTVKYSSCNILLQLFVLGILFQNACSRYYPNIVTQNENELKIIIVGDWGEEIFQGQERVAQGMATWAAENNPDWILSMGDNFYPWGIFSPTDPQVDFKWRNKYNNESLRDLNWFITIGNHDLGERNGHEWNQIELAKIEPRWHLPHLWYDFVIERPQFTAHFIILDTESFNQEINNHTEILPWFQKTLQESTADYKFVIGHRNVFSSGDHGPVSSYMYNAFLPIIEAYGADAYICGHDHNLQHLHYEQPGGPHFVVSGAGGAGTYLYVPENEDILKQTYGVDTRFFHAGFGFVTLTIEEAGEEAIFRYHQPDSKLKYVFTIPKSAN